MPDFDSYATIALFGPNAYIEEHAAAYDAIFPGFGDILRLGYGEAVKVIWDHWLCDCDLTAEHHRCNCTGTPIWGQTMRDLDMNPWTLMTPSVCPDCWTWHAGESL